VQKVLSNGQGPSAATIIQTITIILTSLLALSRRDSARGLLSRLDYSALLFLLSDSGYEKIKFLTCGSRTFHELQDVLIHRTTV